MGSTRRRFTEEYRQHAVRLVLDSGDSIAEIARSIGVHEMTLGKWVKKRAMTARNRLGRSTTTNGPNSNAFEKKSSAYEWRLSSQIIPRFGLCRWCMRVFGNSNGCCGWFGIT